MTYKPQNSKVRRKHKTLDDLMYHEKIETFFIGAVIFVCTIGIISLAYSGIKDIFPRGNFLIILSIAILLPSFFIVISYFIGKWIILLIPK